MKLLLAENQETILLHEQSPYSVSGKTRTRYEDIFTEYIGAIDHILFRWMGGR